VFGKRLVTPAVRSGAVSRPQVAPSINDAAGSVNSKPTSRAPRSTSEPRAREFLDGNPSREPTRCSLHVRTFAVVLRAVDAADEGSVATSRGLAGDILPRKSLEASASTLPVMHCTLEHR